jgi:hypothetical protein
MTEYSAGRSRICCRKASAMTSLTMIFLAGLRVLELHPRAAVDQLGAELLLGQRIAPVTKAAFGELHDVALVHERDRRLVVVDGVLDGALRTSRSVPSRETGLMPMEEVFGKRIFLTPISLMQDLDQLLALSLSASNSMPA